MAEDGADRGRGHPEAFRGEAGSHREVEVQGEAGSHREEGEEGEEGEEAAGEEEGEASRWSP